MNKLGNNPPSGTRDFNGEYLQFKDYVFEKIKALCSQRGFTRIDTPAVENIETLAGKYGEEGDQLIFKILKRGEKAKFGGTDLALRYDLTVPAMRFFARNKENLPKIFKRYQFGSVWRADRPGKARYREFSQFDFDIYGSNSILSDIECMKIAIDSLLCLGIKDFVVNLNSRDIISSMLEVYKIPEAIRPEVLRAVDKIDKVGIDKTIEVIKNLTVSDSMLLFLEDFSHTNFPEILKKKISNNIIGQRGVSDISTIISILRNDNKDFKIVFNPFMVRGLDYYTGPIYEITSENGKGSIAAGGRYDKLSSIFLKKEVPVCGSSLGIERILLLLGDNGVSQPKPTAYVGCWSDGIIDQKISFSLATLLRDSDISCEVDLLGTKISKQISYASKLGARFFVFQGPEERCKDILSIKDLSTSAQLQMSEKEVISYIKRII